MLVGTTIGERAIIVPLSIAATAFIARLLENSFIAVDKQLIEAARSFGANNMQIIFRVIIRETIPSIISIITLATVNYIAATTIACLLYTSSIYLDMAIALLLALLSSKIIKMVHLPNVTGYLIMGLLAGPSFLNIISLETIGNFSIVPEVALGFIAFSIGAEFKLDYFKKIGRSPIIIAILEALGATLFVVVALIAAGFDVSFSLLLGAIASATAPAATLMVIRQYKAKGPVTDTLLPVVAIDDAIAIKMCIRDSYWRV